MIGIALSMVSNPSQVTVIQQAIAVLRRFGTDAHIYLPGVGMINGLQAGNYLDSAGTTPGTVDQPVGLVLDSAGGLGVELIALPMSGSGSGSWTVSSASVTRNGSLTGQANISLVDSQVVPTTKTYRVTFTVSGFSGDSFAFRNGGGAAYGPISANGAYTYNVVGGGATGLTVIPWSGTAGQATIDNISVREVTGIHASQPTTASKPILRRGAVNLLTYSGDFGSAAWTKASITVNGPELTTAVSGGNSIRQTYSVTPGSVYTLAIQVRRGTMSDARVSVWNVTAGSNVLHDSYIGETNTLTDVIVTRSFTAPAGCTSVYVYPLRDSASTGTMFVASAALFTGTYTAAQIQALGGIPLTTTAPASTALGPQYWSFDGSNDSLQLGGPLFQMADDHCVVAGVNSSNSSTGYLCNFGYGAGPQMVCALYSAGTFGVAWRDDAGLIRTINSATSYLNTSVVISALKIGNTKRLRVNGAYTGAADTTVMGVTTSTAGFIGDWKPSGGNLFSGSAYPVIAIKGTIGDSDLLLLEKFVGQLSGVQI